MSSGNGLAGQGGPRDHFFLVKTDEFGENRLFLAPFGVLISVIRRTAPLLGQAQAVWPGLVAGQVGAD